MESYGSCGYMDFSKLWALMKEKGFNKKWLKDNGLNSNTINKLTKNDNVTCKVLCKLCQLLSCQPSDIMTYKR